MKNNKIGKIAMIGITVVVFVLLWVKVSALDTTEINKTSAEQLGASIMATPVNQQEKMMLLTASVIGSAEYLTAQPVPTPMAEISTPNTTPEVKPVEEPKPVVPARPTFPETQVTGNKVIELEKLRATVRAIAPALSGTEEAMLQIYNETGIKPSFQLAKFCLESGYGKSGLSINKNNIAGWGAYPAGGRSAYQNALSFKTKGDCVLTVGRSLHKNYISAGRTTVASIAKKYCPVNSTNWTNSVTSLMNRIEREYAKH